MTRVTRMTRSSNSSRIPRDRWKGRTIDAHEDSPRVTEKLRATACALIACCYRAAEWEHTDVMLAAHNLLVHLDKTRNLNSDYKMGRLNFRSLRGRAMASAEDAHQLTGVVNASAVVVRRIPGVASTCSKTAWRCAVDRATTRHNRSPEPVTLCTSRTSGMSDRAVDHRGLPALHDLERGEGQHPEADRTEIDDGPESR